MIQNIPRRENKDRKLFVLPYSCREDQAVVLVGAIEVRGNGLQLVLARESMKKEGEE